MLLLNVICETVIFICINEPTMKMLSNYDLMRKRSFLIDEFFQFLKKYSRLTRVNASAIQESATLGTIFTIDGGKDDGMEWN